MEIHYRDRAFRYEPSPTHRFTGRLLLDDEERAWLDRMDDRDDGWYLDAAGRRLPPEALFAASPWSRRGPGGTVKLVQRFLHWETGETRFDTPEDYFGELADWVYAPRPEE